MYIAQLVCPPAHLCRDNGAMIAWAAIEHAAVGNVDLASRLPTSDGGEACPYVAHIKGKWPLGRDYRELVDPV